MSAKEFKKGLEVCAGSAFEIEIDAIATDKSISHRCAIFSLLSNKPSKIKNFLKAEDTLNSLGIAAALGAKAQWEGDTLTITPPSSLSEPDDVLDCGNSGTTIRLMSGFLSSIDGFFVLTGDKYLRRRPMKRVAEPLRSVGAKIDGRDGGNFAPLAIRGAKLDGITFDSKISSAQVKSALILAALNAKSPSVISEPELSRDHTERMLVGMGADIKVADKIYVSPMSKPLEPLNMSVPSDPSSAFFFAVAAAITEGAKVTLKNLTLNPTRVEAFVVLQKMGAKVEFVEKENVYEPIGDIIVEGAKLKAVEVSENISWLIDELPALSIAMAVAEGESVVKNAKELRVKESDRITTVMTNLRAFGIECEEFEDGYKIRGGELKSAHVTSFGDHRLAMSFAIASLKCGGKIDGFEAVSTSFPNFVQLLSKITQVREYEL
ncbi:MAG: 3-phosphoshikimate 1-carboxyvinyltransferase [Campylobacteraceae bacterium]|nr:3-phosphoshikimate 1-carboxyvinyltransferase [Campylobacteraceae bacterium]